MSRHPVRQGVSEVDAVAATATYRELIERLKQRIRESQARAARAVNTELVMLYWWIGREIVEEQQTSGWGDDIVGRITPVYRRGHRLSPRLFAPEPVLHAAIRRAMARSRESAISDGTNHLDGITVS